MSITGIIVVGNQIYLWLLVCQVKNRKILFFGPGQLYVVYICITRLYVHNIIVCELFQERLIALLPTEIPVVGNLTPIFHNFLQISRLFLSRREVIVVEQDQHPIQVVRDHFLDCTVSEHWYEPLQLSFAFVWDVRILPYV